MGGSSPSWIADAPDPIGVPFVAATPAEQELPPPPKTSAARQRILASTDPPNILTPAMAKRATTPTRMMYSARFAPRASRVRVRLRDLPTASSPAAMAGPQQAPCLGPYFSFQLSEPIGRPRPFCEIL